ncbi:hypothetical protein [Burkholderia gladioli]|uniref:hypothetical protein n=1 Tax=Burkholderia gladioli TaxID=28095 RepID=UPI00163F6FF2|nr:hypothetical protein [Burkholderia gladioli]
MKSLEPLFTSSNLLIITIAVVAITVAMMSALIALMVATRDRSKSKYDTDAQRAQLSMMRETYDKKLSELTAQLLATEARWKDVNHLQLSAQIAQNKHSTRTRPQLTRFLESLGITENDLVIDSRLVFVLTPFDEAHARQFQIIQKVCARVGFNCVRGDEEQVFGDILPHIMRTMTRANVVIANIGSRNPNVYYELGIAQALDKTTVLISEADFKPAFDLQSRRIVFFNNESELETKLLETFARMTSHGTRIDL